MNQARNAHKTSAQKSSFTITLYRIKDLIMHSLHHVYNMNGFQDDQLKLQKEKNNNPEN